MTYRTLKFVRHFIKEEDEWLGPTLTLLGITLFLSILTLMLIGCAAQPPPPAPIVQVVAPPPKIVVPPDPLEGLLPDVQAAIKNHQTPVLEEGIATFYPYSPNVSQEIYCTPLSATEIRLNKDETTDKDAVVLGDSLRWAIKVGKQAVMVEPLGTTADPHMVTNLIIATNRRSYHFTVKLRKQPMAAIAFYYPDDVAQLQAARATAQREADAQAQAEAAKQAQQQAEQTAAAAAKVTQ